MISHYINGKSNSINNIKIGLYLAVFFHNQWNSVKKTAKYKSNLINVLSWIIFGINVVQ